MGLGNENGLNSEIDDVVLAETLNNSIECNQSHPVIEDIRDRLAKSHGVDKNDIAIKAVYAGSFNIVYTVGHLTKAVVKKVQTVAKELKTQFKQYLSAKIHPLLYRPTFDISRFDSRGNKTFYGEPETYEVGPPGKTKTYTTAAGWTRYVLKVLGKYENESWLDPFGHPGNWYRAFHGTGSAKAVDFGKSDNSVDMQYACVDATASIFETGFKTARIAAYGPGVYCSPNPVWLDNSPYVGTVELDTVYGKKSFNCMLQVAVNPDGVRHATDDIWVAAKPQDIQPYGILIKEA